MRVVLYEFVLGGGFLGADHAPPASLLREGQAMATALAADLVRAGAEVDVLRDARFGDVAFPACRVHEVATAEAESSTLAQRAAAADWTIVIAPEFDGHLLTRTKRVAAAGGRLLGPPHELVALAADKQALAEHLAAAGIAVPLGLAIGEGESLPAGFSYPAVLKPRDGAGSQGIELVREAPRGSHVRSVSGPMRFERYCPGTAASVALLCGPAATVSLAACRQRLSDDGRFTYLGGELPLPPALNARATALAQRAVATLEAPFGYLGVDLVLGADPAGRDDVVIEINPRLTTSYVGLRAATDQNLAVAMLEVAAGGSPRLLFDLSPLQFEPDGRIDRRDQR